MTNNQLVDRLHELDPDGEILICIDGSMFLPLDNHIQHGKAEEYNMGIVLEGANKPVIILNPVE